jgi:hypothetical protein
LKSFIPISLPIYLITSPSTKTTERSTRPGEFFKEVVVPTKGEVLETRRNGLKKRRNPDSKHTEAMRDERGGEVKEWLNFSWE